MSLARLGRRARLAVARLHTAQDRGLVGLAVAGAALVGHIVLVRERPQDAGAGAGGLRRRQRGVRGAAGVLAVSKKRWKRVEGGPLAPFKERLVKETLYWG